MSTNSNENDSFTLPGVVQVSVAALNLARSFEKAASRRGDHVVVFDWAESIAVRLGPNEPLEDTGACLMIGAYERRQVPARYIQKIGGLEFAIRIPRAVWEKSVRRMIDVDSGTLFKLALR